jgi:hypothetical protein
LLGLEPLPRDPSDKIKLISAKAAGDDLDLNRRTIGRRIASRKRGEAA